jgi:hypothetical protein
MGLIDTAGSQFRATRDPQRRECVRKALAQGDPLAQLHVFGCLELVGP